MSWPHQFGKVSGLYLDSENLPNVACFVQIIYQVCFSSFSRIILYQLLLQLIEVIVWYMIMFWKVSLWFVNESLCWLLICISSYCRLVPGPDDMLVLDIAFMINLKFEEYPNALLIALFLDNKEVCAFKKKWHVFC